MTFAAYILCFYAQFLFDFVTFTFDLLILAVSDKLSYIHLTHMPIFSILRFSVPELWVTQYDNITITWYGHCVWVVSRNLSPGGGGKNDPHFVIPDPEFTYSLCHF